MKSKIPDWRDNADYQALKARVDALRVECQTKEAAIKRATLDYRAAEHALAVAEDAAFYGTGEIAAVLERRKQAREAKEAMEAVTNAQYSCFDELKGIEAELAVLVKALKDKAHPAECKMFNELGERYEQAVLDLVAVVADGHEFYEAMKDQHAGRWPGGYNIFRWLWGDFTSENIVYWRKYAADGGFESARGRGSQLTQAIGGKIAKLRDYAGHPGERGGAA